MQKQIYKQTFNYDYSLQDAVIEERHEQIVELARQQQEINEIMQNLAILTDQQGGVIDDLRQNITSANKNTKDGVQSLEKAEEHQKTGNKLSLYVLIGTIVSVLTAGSVTIAMT